MKVFYKCTRTGSSSGSLAHRSSRPSPRRRFESCEKMSRLPQAPNPTHAEGDTFANVERRLHLIQTVENGLMVMNLIHCTLV
jgi:hypothetical protein